MFRISEKHSGYGKKQIKELKKDEKKRQKFRKKMHPISRELDNYYQPKLHDKGWFPNGLYILKKNIIMLILVWDIIMKKIILNN